jgi:adenylate cyclase
MARAGKGLPLRPTLVTVVVGLILVTAGTVGYSAYSSSRRVLSHLWHNFSAEIAANATQRTLRFLEPAVPAVALEEQLAHDGILDPIKKQQPALEYFEDVLLANPSFTWVSYGSANGLYLAVHRTAAGGIQATLREPVMVDGKPRTRWRDFLHNAAGGWEPWRDDTNEEYDPRKRPWYFAATQNKAGTWVEPFLFASNQQPGFIYAAPDYGPDGAQRGVWAIEFEVTYVSQFLASMRVGKSGRVYVVSRSGLVVGHPTGDVTETVNGVKEIARAEHHQDPMLAGAWKAMEGRPPGIHGFSFGPYLAMVADFPPESGIDWLVIGVVPKLDYFGEAEQQLWFSVAVGALGALLASFLGALLLRRVSDAMRDISDEMDRIGRFELTERKLSSAPSIIMEVNRMSEATDRMKSSLRSFGRYVPRELVQDLLQSGRDAVLGGEKLVITTLFSDIAGFTTLSESMEPSALVSLLGDYFGRMSDTVREHQGTVDKYIGDAIMAFWGAPRPLQDHAVAACRCALAMRDRLRAMQAEWAKQGRPSIAARIGVNTGEAVVGNIGSPERMNYTAMGDTVNLASRLEGLNKSYGTGILIGETTAAMVSEHMVLRPVDFVAVKGKAKAVLVHELLGEKGQVADAQLRAAEMHREALDLYRARNFSEAGMRFFEVFVALGKADPASRKLAERCKEFINEPPPDDWSGEYVMLEK